MATIEINYGVTSMTLLLFIGSVIFALAGLIFFSAARGAVHETAALVLFLTSAVMLVGAPLNNAANRIIDVLRERLAAPSRMTQPAADQPGTKTAPHVADTTTPDIHETPPEPKTVPNRSWVDVAKSEIEAEKS
jgi:hypothetical protein